MSSATFDDIFDGIDIDGDGIVSYSEFITAAMSKTVLTSDHFLKMAFDHLDTNLDGYLDREKFKAVFETQGCANVISPNMDQIWIEFI